MVKIYGASDDLVEIEGHPDGDEIGCYDRDVVIMLGTVETGGIAVRMSYAPRFSALGDGVAAACWSAEIAQLDEDRPIPWPVRLGTVRYSVAVLIDAPPETPLRFIAVNRDN